VTERTADGPGRDRETEIDAEVHHPRCPYCHEAVTPADEEKRSCGSCMAWHHAECWDEHQGCAACGDATTPRSRTASWWKINAAVSAVFLVGLTVAGALKLGDIDLHRIIAASAAGALTLLTTVLSVLRTGQDFSGARFTGRARFGPWLGEKLGGLAWSLGFLVALPLVHIIELVGAGVVHPSALASVLFVVPIGLLACALQGMLIRLLTRSNGVAMALALFAVLLEGALPFFCCLPSFNLPLTCYFMVQSSGDNLLPMPIFVGTLFSGAVQAACGGAFLGFSRLRHGALVRRAAEDKDKEKDKDKDASQ
jgi:hypothetical protein